MSHHPFRNMPPQRTCTKKRTDYHAYKAFLAEDFNHRCGYTDCSDHWFGGKRNFQIDHLKPKSIYPELVNEYGNLVYCCSYVNNAKSDDDNPNYLDPCNVDFNLHFERDDMGFIKAITPQGEYMVKHMDLCLYRYAICWKLDRLEERIKIFEAKIDKNNATAEEKDLLLNLNREFHKYLEYLRSEL